MSIIKSKTEDLNLIAKSSNKNYDKFKEINSSYKDNIININTNKTENNRVSIEKSIGIVIMIIFITGATIANFIIEDEENNTKSRVLVSGVKPSNYYIALIIVFYCSIVPLLPFLSVFQRVKVGTILGTILEQYATIVPLAYAVI